MASRAQFVVEESSNAPAEQVEQFDSDVPSYIHIENNLDIRAERIRIAGQFDRIRELV